MEFKLYEIEMKDLVTGDKKSLKVYAQTKGDVISYAEKEMLKDSKWEHYVASSIRIINDLTFINETNTIPHAKTNKYDTIISSQEKENDVVSELYDFMIWGDYDAKIQTLANMTDENWNFHGKTNNLILKNYLRYTAKKLEEENKVITTDNYCLMNTGLFTSYYEPIYIYTEKNTGTSDQEWFFKQFATEYELGNLGITELPERANYFQNPNLLIFDASCKINVHYKHILEDENNIARIPDSIKNAKNLHHIFSGAIEIMKKKVTANYKIAVPQYFNGKIQLLLPLCLVDSDIPDLALVVTKNQSGNFYQGHTCLTMEMAYNNARLIAKPESNWLLP